MKIFLCQVILYMKFEYKKERGGGGGGVLDGFPFVLQKCVFSIEYWTTVKLIQNPTFNAIIHKDW